MNILQQYYRNYSKILTKKFVDGENHSLITIFRVQLNLIRGDFERTIVRPGVPFERTIVWSEVILRAQSSGRWSGFCLGHGCTIVWTMFWFWSDQRSFPSGKLWSETALSALGAHTVFRAHFSLIRGYFGLGWSEIRGYFCLARSDQRFIPDGTSTGRMCGRNCSTRSVFHSYLDKKHDWE